MLGHAFEVGDVIKGKGPNGSVFKVHRIASWDGEPQIQIKSAYTYWTCIDNLLANYDKVEG